MLQINVDGNVGSSLPMRRCENCQADTYEGNLVCHQCQAAYEPCIITGMPLAKSNTVHCKICNKGAIREHWNDYIAAALHCPWCKSMQTQY